MTTWIWIARLEGPRGRERYGKGMHRVTLLPDATPPAVGTVLYEEDLAGRSAACGKSLARFWKHLDEPSARRGRREVRVVAVSVWDQGDPVLHGSVPSPCADCARGVVGARLLQR